MQRVPLNARVSADINSAARAKAAADGVSLSAVVERALAEYLKAGAEPSDKPAWAIAASPWPAPLRPCLMA